MEILYQDVDILVCIKPARVLSTDEPGGLPELVRESLGDKSADVRTVHRLDRVVSGLMVLASSGYSLCFSFSRRFASVRSIFSNKCIARLIARLPITSCAI